MINIVNFYRKLNKSYAFYTELLKIYILDAIDSIILHIYFPLIRLDSAKVISFFRQISSINVISR